MKTAPIIICFIAIYCVTLSTAAPVPEPFLGFIGDAAKWLWNTGVDIVSGAFGIFFGAIKGILGGALGGIVGGVLGTGLFGEINTDPDDGGCQATNVAEIIENLFRVLQIPVVECSSNSDCRDVGTGTCGPVEGIPNVENICQLISA